MRPSELELQILSLLWDRGPSTAREVLENLPDEKQRAYTSVLSMLQLMDRKGLVKRTREGLKDLWRPAQARKSILGNYFSDLLKKVFGGSASTAILHLLDSTKVDEAELTEIERIVREHRERLGK